MSNTPVRNTDDSLYKIQAFVNAVVARLNGLDLDSVEKIVHLCLEIRDRTFYHRQVRGRYLHRHKGRHLRRHRMYEPARSRRPGLKIYSQIVDYTFEELTVLEMGHAVYHLTASSIDRAKVELVELDVEDFFTPGEPSLFGIQDQ